MKFYNRVAELALLAKIEGLAHVHAPGYQKDDVLAFYMLTGGVAKYVELLVQNKIFSLPAIIDHVFTENSLFLRKVKTC